MSEIRPGRLNPGDYDANFNDLVPPLRGQEALVEASRCYFCYDAPCMEACPTSIDIPSFIRKIQTGNLKGSAETILSSNIMGGTCARVCPTEVLCEEVCVREISEGKPVKIGQLQRHAVDWLMAQDIQPFTRAHLSGKRVAVIGAGPAGLACAHALSLLGHDITVYERRDKAGGLNEYGIAAYKMAGEFAQREVDFITSIGGIDLRYGQLVAVTDLMTDYDAVFVGCGLGDTNALGLEDEELDGVVDAVSFIETLRQSPKDEVPVGRNVVVIGGGNTAIDASIQSKRLGAEEVTLVYRRGPEAMGATGHEQELAKTNGVIIRHWARPFRIVKVEGGLDGIEFERTKLDDQGKLVGTGEIYSLAADQIMKAIGQAYDGHQGLALEQGKIAVDAHGKTSLGNVWAGGDATVGEDLTVVAVEDGKIAAAAIDQFLKG